MFSSLGIYYGLRVHSVDLLSACKSQSKCRLSLSAYTFQVRPSVGLMIVNQKSTPCVSFADEPSSKKDRSAMTDAPANACSYSEVVPK